MSNILENYSILGKQLEEIQKNMAEIENNEDFKKEILFKKDLEKVIKNHGMTREKALAALGGVDRESLESKEKNGKSRKKRKLKVYTNPHTGDVIETRGGNHAVIKEWKAEYGADEVESWLQLTD